MFKDLDYLDRILYFKIQGMFVFWWFAILIASYFLIYLTIEIITIKRRK